MKYLSIIYILIFSISLNNGLAEESSKKPILTGKARFFSRPKGTRSIWIWKSYEILKSPAKQKKLISLLKNPPGNAPKITNIYFSSNINYIRSKKLKLKLIQFIINLHTEGITFQYLDGSPSWGHQNYDVFTLMEYVKKFNQSVSTDARIDGIHLDIEPHTLPIWGTNPKLRLKFFESVKKYGQRMHKINPDIVFGIDIPTFYNEEEINQLLQATDYLSLMNYTDNAGLMVKRASKFLKIADRLGKKIESGVETQPPSHRWGVTPPITFWEEGWKIMEDRLKQAETKMAQHPSYIGIAIHYYNSYKKIAKDRTEIKDTQTYPVQEIINIPFLHQNITIDGSLDECQTIPPININTKEHLIYEITPHRWRNSKNLSAIAYLGWKKNGFYIAIDVTDDKIVQNFTGEDMINGDHIELWFDIDYEKDEYQPYINEDDYQFGLSPGNFSTVKKSICLWVPTLLDEPSFDSIKYAVRKSDHGYTMELFIPFSFFGNVTLKANDKIRFDIDPSDTDGDNDIQEVLLSTSICRQYGNPRSFRTGILRK